MKGLRRARLWTALVLVVISRQLVSVDPASALGALASPTFTAPGSYAQTGAKDTAYSYSFTTASSAPTLQRFKATVPAGTDSYNQRYVALSGSGYAISSDSTANSVTGDIDIRVEASLRNWATGSLQVLASKRDWNDTSTFSLAVSANNALEFITNNGTNLSNGTNATLAYAANQTVWVRGTRVASTGVARIYTSNDGVNWTQVATNTQTAGALNDNAYPVLIGAITSSGVPGSAPSAGRFYYFDERNVIGGTTSASVCSGAGVVNCFNPADATQTQSVAGSWASSSATGETWSVGGRTGTLPADIGSDLTVSNLSGLPSGGYAMYRMMDGVAIYVFTATSISAATPVTIMLTGFTNTTTAGSYTATLSTINSAGSLVDSATTGSVTFTNTLTNQSASATVDPTFTFTVSNQSTACNGESNFVSGAGSPTSVSLGHTGINANVSGGQALTVASNTGSGFAVYVRGAQATQNLRNGTYSWIDVSGTYASPAALGSGEKFGYTFKDSTASSSVTNPASAMFAALTSTNQAIVGSASSSNGSGCISYDAQTAATTPAGSYTATITYVAVPTF